MQGQLNGKGPCLHQNWSLVSCYVLKVCDFDIYLGHGSV